jgi:hypothetical protein
LSIKPISGLLAVESRFNSPDTAALTSSTFGGAGPGTGSRLPNRDSPRHWPVRGHKIVAGWLAEKATRLKPNANVLTRSPLSDLIELETLYLGIQGKAGGWRVLLAVVDELRIEAGARLFSHG